MRMKRHSRRSTPTHRLVCVGCCRGCSHAFGLCDVLGACAAAPRSVSDAEVQEVKNLISTCKSAISEASDLQTLLESDADNLKLINRFVTAANNCRAPLDKFRSLISDLEAEEEVAVASSLADAAGDLSMCQSVLRRLATTTEAVPELDSAVCESIDDARRAVSLAENLLVKVNAASATAHVRRVCCAVCVCVCVCVCSRHQC